MPQIKSKSSIKGIRLNQVQSNIYDKKLFRKNDLKGKLRGAILKSEISPELVKSVSEKLGMPENFLIDIINNLNFMEGNYPDEFIPKIEKDGMIVDFSKTVAITTTKYVDQVSQYFGRSQRNEDDYDKISISANFNILNISEILFQKFLDYFSKKGEELWIMAFPNGATYSLLLILDSLRMFYNSGFKNIDFLIPHNIKKGVLILKSGDYEIFIAPIIDKIKGGKEEWVDPIKTIPWDNVLWFFTLPLTQIKELKDLEFIYEEVWRKYRDIHNQLKTFSPDSMDELITIENETKDECFKILRKANRNIATEFLSKEIDLSKFSIDQVRELYEDFIVRYPVQNIRQKQSYKYSKKIITELEKFITENKKRLG